MVQNLCMWWSWSFDTWLEFHLVVMDEPLYQIPRLEKTDGSSCIGLCSATVFLFLFCSFGVLIICWHEVPCIEAVSEYLREIVLLTSFPPTHNIQGWILQEVCWILNSRGADSVILVAWLFRSIPPVEGTLLFRVFLWLITLETCNLHDGMCPWLLILPGKRSLSKLCCLLPAYVVELATKSALSSRKGAYSTSFHGLEPVRLLIFLLTISKV